MSLAKALDTHKVSLKGPKCSVCTVIAVLSKDDAAALDAALSDQSFTGAAISRALKDEGHNISGAAVMRHRKRECQR